MKLVKSLLLGSAAGFCAVAGAQAADLPVRRAAPVEYVRVCTAHGAGFFYIPGTDTCLRIGGRARFSYQYTSSRAFGPNINGTSGSTIGASRDRSGYESLAFINLDARTSTGYGTLRTFIRVIAGYGSGGFLTSTTNQRFAFGFPGLGQDTNGRAYSLMYLDKAFIQFAGFTFGRTSSFYDFYAHDLEFHSTSASSDVSSTNLAAYTATFGSGWSATISLEDPVSRRQPIFTNQAFGNSGNGAPFLSTTQGAFTTLGGTFTQSVAYRSPTGTIRFANYDVVQRSAIPDVVGVVRYDAPWGALQVSAAMHELRGGNLVNTQAATFSGTTGLLGATDITGELNGAPGTATNVAALPPRIRPEIGWAVQGGMKLNLPQLATGDVLWLQAAYSEGAQSYAGIPGRWGGREAATASLSGRFAYSTVDSFIGSDFKQKLTETWSIAGAFLHYWSPEWRSAAFGSYGEVTHGQGARNGVTGPGTLIIDPANRARGLQGLANSASLKDYSVMTLGANLIWSPVKDLDIGLEGIYTRLDLKGGPVADTSKGAVAQTGFQLNGAPSTGTNGIIPAKTAKYDDVFAVRMRVQRDF